MANIGSITLPSEPTKLSYGYATENVRYINVSGDYVTTTDSLTYRRFNYSFTSLNESDIQTFRNAYNQTMPVSITIAGVTYTGFVVDMKVTYDQAAPFLAQVDLDIEEQP